MKFYALYFLCIAAAISSAKPVANQDLAYGEPATSRPVGKSCMADNNRGVWAARGGCTHGVRASQHPTDNSLSCCISGICGSSPTLGYCISSEARCPQGATQTSAMCHGISLATNCCIPPRTIPASKKTSFDLEPDLQLDLVSTTIPNDEVAYKGEIAFNDHPPAYDEGLLYN